MGDPDRLSALDTSFLQLEDAGNAHMHVAGVMIFEGQPPDHEEMLERMEARLHLVPRYRQKLAFVPGGQARPKWVDDPHFNLRYHLRRTALPSPGSEAELRALAGRVFSQRLDRDRPIWEQWVAEGLDGDRFAMLSKSHHCLVDGVSGVDIATVMFDLDREPPAAPVPEPWAPRPEPSSADLVAGAARDAATGAVGVARGAVGAARRPGDAVGTARSALEGVRTLAESRIRPAPETPYNRTVGPHRRFTWVRGSLDEFKRIKNSLGGTLNDVVLAAMTGALRRHLRRRGEAVPDELKAMVPVSTRADAERGALGNRVTTIYAPLPTGIRGPAARLAKVSESMAGLKESGQAVGAQVLTELTGFAPPTVMAQAARQAGSSRLFNVTITNVPGPQFPLYMGGSEMLDLFPMVPLAPEHGLGVAIMSYNGRINFGLVGDWDLLWDIEDLARDLDESIAELAEAAGTAHADEGAAEPDPAANA